VEGCEYVCHVAAVVELQPEGDPQKEVVDPAVEGTRNVFNSIAQGQEGQVRFCRSIQYPCVVSSCNVYSESLPTYTA